MSKRICYVVIGMHRSGTSAVTRGLAAAGVELGNRLGEEGTGALGNEHNEKGYFENETAVEINDALLELLDCSWHELSAFPADWLQRTEVAALVDEAASRLSREFSGSVVWGFKDPRSSRLLPFWAAVLTAMDTRMRVVWVTRHPLSSAASLGRRDGFPYDKSLWLWLDHVLLAARDVPAEDTLIVNYDLVLEDRAGEWERLQRFVGAEVSHTDVEAYLGEFLDNGLQHTRFSTEDLASNPLASVAMIDAHAQLDALARDRLSWSSPENLAFWNELNQDWVRQVTLRTCLQSNAISSLCLSPGAAPTFAASRQLASKIKFTHASSAARVAICVHLHYPETWPHIEELLARQRVPFALYVSLTDSAFDEVSDSIRERFPQAYLVRIENRGRDIAPFLTLLRKIHADGHRYVCKVHGKKTAHRESGEQWRRALLEPLLGRADSIARVTRYFDAHPDVGLLGPRGHLLPMEAFWGGNRDNVDGLMQRLRLGDLASDERFFAGSMFWCRVDGMAALIESSIGTADFEEEAGQFDGTLAHAIERIFPLVVRKQGFRTVETGFETYPDSWLASDGRSEGQLVYVEHMLNERSDMAAACHRAVLLAERISDEREQVSAELAEVRKNLSDTQQSLVITQQSLSDTQKALAGSQEQASTLQAQLNEAMANALQLEQRLSFERQCAESRQQSLLQQLVEIKLSRSWRMTAPLRSLSRRLSGVRSKAATLRRHVGRLAERVYRAAPLNPKLKRGLKGLVFRMLGPLLRRTSAYQRWQAHVRTHAADISSMGNEERQQPTFTLVGDDGVRAADGVWEWQDHTVVRDRIMAELARQQQEKQVKSRTLLNFSKGDLHRIAAGIQLPRCESAPTVTILIPVYNQIRRTLECLASIAANAESGGPDFEVLLADDASHDETAEVLATISNLRVVRQPENLGFLRNCNAAASEARGRYLLLLNNDVQVCKGWLRALVDCIEADQSIAAVGPKIVYPSGWLQEAGTALRRDGSSEMIGLNDLPQAPRYNYSRDVDYCSGACLLLRREDFQSLGGFDEAYVPAYCEDSDLCMRLRAKGGRIVYCPQAEVVHHLSVSSNQLSEDYKLRCTARNLNTFSNRWQAELECMDDVRTIAFYLPQFHPIPENDRWWGRGFTEWTNVSKARPNFSGHYQPRFPADLGYYDLRLPEVMEKQAELAKRYGVGGFCYYYYWFAGQRLLERPIETMLESGRPDMPFCLCWANENWTRRWDGEERDVLMAQKHSEADDRAVILDLIRYFRSPNYIRIGGKPLLVVYRVGLFPDFRKTAERWREICRQEGIGEIYLAQVESFEMVSAGVRPEQMGCDAAIEFPPHGMAEPYPLTAPLLNPDFQGAVADYRDLAVRYGVRDLPGYKRFLGVATGWDNTARRQNHSYCFEHATPGAFQAWLEAAIARTKQQFSGDERLVFINAWNEWAEGAYLEPDRRYGHAFLQAHANAKEASYLLRQHHYSLG